MAHIRGLFSNPVVDCLGSDVADATFGFGKEVKKQSYSPAIWRLSSISQVITGVGNYRSTYL